MNAGSLVLSRRKRGGFDSPFIFSELSLSKPDRESSCRRPTAALSGNCLSCSGIFMARIVVVAQFPLELPRLISNLSPRAMMRPLKYKIFIATRGAGTVDQYSCLACNVLGS